MEKISQRWIDPEILFSLHPLAIEHRHSYSKMIKMVHLLSMLNKDEHDDLRKDLLYIYNYVKKQRDFPVRGVRHVEPERLLGTEVPPIPQELHALEI